MEITNDTKLEYYLLRGELGETQRLTVVLKGTFTIPTAGVSEWAEEPLPVFEADQYNDFKIPGSARFESDLVPIKLRTDVVLVGKAHAPGRRPATAVIATLRFGSLASSVAVVGDRYWKDGKGLFSSPQMTPPEPFLAMDLIYERAFGGIDLDEKQKGEWCGDNPVGAGFIAKARRGNADGRALPNIEDPSNLITSVNDRPLTAGFGYYGRGWERRVAYAGTYNKKWRDERAPRLPKDFDLRFYNGAHPNLQTDHVLSGGEEVELTNLCPDRERVAFRLPRIHPRITFAGPALKAPRGQVVQNPKMDTVCFLPEEGTLYSVWRGGLSIADDSSVAELAIGLD